MKIALWLLCFFLGAIWTGLAALSIEATKWIAYGIPSGQIIDPTSWTAQWPLPAWLSSWIDPMWISVVQSAVQSAMTMAGDLVHNSSTAVSWMASLIWMAWGVGMFVLLLIGCVGHWLIGKFQRHLLEDARQQALS